MISIHDQGGLIVHHIDHLPNEILSVEEFASNFWVLASVSMPGGVSTNHMQEQEIEVAAFFQLFRNVRYFIIIDFVNISDV